MRTPHSLTIPGLVLATLISVTACNGSGGPPPEPTTDATVQVNLSWPALGGSCNNNTDLAWAAQPVAMDASGTGSTSAQSKSSGPVGNFPASGDTCTVSQTFASLHPGEWTFTATAAAPKSAHLNTGLNFVTLTR